MPPPLGGGGISHIQVIDVNKKSIIIAEVLECDLQYRPCYNKSAGIQSSSFLRVGNQSQRMTPYEIDTFMVGQGQPVFDRELVKTAFLSDLDEKQPQGCQK
jgi:predicted HTH transcriptional regulator